MPIDLLMPLQPFLKFEKYCIDNNVFRLHYRFTVVLLLIFTLLVSLKQFFGEPIQCMAKPDVPALEVINTYCWMHGTYAMKANFQADAQKKISYPGLGPEEGGETLRYPYYQWVPVVLLTQCFLFYIPRYIWKLWEGGRLKALAENLATPLIPKEWNKKRKNQLINYLSHTNIYTHNVYAFRFAFCEFLNCVNVIMQIYFLGIFLGGSFSNYGLAFIASLKSYNTKDTYDPLAIYFPKQTKCRYENYGPSGTVQNFDYVCVLAYNVINEKLFIVVWFWFVFLAVISVLSVIYRLMVFTIPPLRTLLIFGQVRYTPKHQVNKVVRKFCFGDWFLLYQLGKNMNPIVFKELVDELADELNSKPVLV